MDELKKLVAAMTAMLDKADAEKRGLTDGERLAYDTMDRRADELREADKVPIIRRYVAPVGNGRKQDPFFIRGCEPDDGQYSITRALATLAQGRSLDGMEGEMSRELEIRMGRAPQGVGFFIPPAALATRERRDLEVGTPTAGGNLVQTTVADAIIEILRPRLAVARLGATMLANLQGDLALPRQTAKSIAGWKTEKAAFDESNPTVDQVEIEPHRLGSFCEYTRQLLYQSSPSVESFIRNDLTRAIAEAIDLAAIAGSGVGAEPEGILTNSDIATLALGTNGAALTRADVVQLETLLSNSNADAGSLGYLTNSKVRGKLKSTLVDAGSGKFVWGDDNRLNGYLAEVSNQVSSTLTKGASEVCSAMIYGNWADLVIGSWGPGIELLVNPYSRDTEGLIRVTAWNFVDVAVRRNESFIKIKDALTA